MEYPPDHACGMICAACGKAENTKDGGFLLRCGGCAKLTWCGALYCSTECQSKNWPTHKQLCVPVRKRFEGLPARDLLALRSLSNFAHHYYYDIGDLGISALGLVDFPENADLLRVDIAVSCHNDPITKAINVRVDSIQVVDIAKRSPEFQQRQRSVKGSSSNVVYICAVQANLFPEVGRPPKELHVQALPFVLDNPRLQVQHQRGMPINNWTQYFTAKLNKASSIPSKTTLATTPPRWIPPHSEPPSYSDAVMEWIEPHFEHIATAALLAASIERRTLGENVIIIYICENPNTSGSSDRFLGVSALSQSVEDVVPTHFQGSMDGFRIHRNLMASLRKMPVENLPSVIVHTIGSGIWYPLFLPDPTTLPHIKQPILDEKFPAATWKQFLLRRLGIPDRKVVNEAYRGATGSRS